MLPLAVAGVKHQGKMDRSRITRRALLASAGASALLAQRDAKAGGRRLLWNCDGSAIHCWGNSALNRTSGTLTRDEFVSLVFTPFDGTPVDTLLFSFGNGNVAEYQSNVLEWPGQADDFQFPKSRTWHGGIEVDAQDQYRNPKSLADAGHNPPEVIVQECRKRGLGAFVSLRMNDTHDGQHSRGSLPNPELPAFKRQNPDWLVEDLDRWSALDYRKPQVRALKLRVIEEFFDRWDFDGIELDWLRHTLNFPRGTEKANAHYLTEFMESVRASLNARAVKRGRPIEIGVRIPERTEWCEEGGFEIRRWIEKDLADFLILGQGLTEVPSLTEFRGLMKKRRLPLYPCLYSYGNGYRLSPDEVIRGDAANLWRDGADGLYLFNWSYYGGWRRPLLHQISDKSALSKLSKHYTVVQRFDSARNIGTDYLRYNTVFRDAHIPFDLEVVDGLKTVNIPIAEIPSEAEIWIGLNQESSGHQLSVRCNGSSLTREDSLEPAGFTMQVPPGNGMLGLPPMPALQMRFSTLRYRVLPKDLKVGRNVVSIQLIKRPGIADAPTKILRVELAAK